MNLKILFLLLVYYGLLSLFFILGGSIISDAGYTTNIELNSTSLTSSEIDTGGIFNTGVSFGRFFSLITFGIGLPSDTPIWFAIMFGVWQTIFTIFAVGFVISSIWNG